MTLVVLDDECHFALSFLKTITMMRMMMMMMMCIMMMMMIIMMIMMMMMSARLRFHKFNSFIHRIAGMMEKFEAEKQDLISHCADLQVYNSFVFNSTRVSYYGNDACISMTVI